MDALYRKELKRLRNSGRSIIEVGSYASSLHSNDDCRSALYLQNAVVLSSIAGGFTDLCIIVNPRHVDYYKKMYQAEQFAAEKYYPNVKAPAVPLHLDLLEYKERFQLHSIVTPSLELEHRHEPASNANPVRPFRPTAHLIARMFELRPDMANALTQAQRRYFIDTYGENIFASSKSQGQIFSLFRNLFPREAPALFEVI
jgi:hypothetical protein